jgi:hypothetical protein
MPTPNPKTVRDKALREAVAEVVTDSSASSGEDNDYAYDFESPSKIYEGPSPQGDAGVPLSFDASRGPSSGSKILGYAIEKAVERFENKTTDKLVKDEYEVLDETGETVHPAPGTKRGKGRKAAAKHTIDEEIDADVDEEYEFV